MRKFRSGDKIQMSDSGISESAVDASAKPSSFWHKIFIGSRGIRSGWRLAIFLVMIVVSLSLVMTAIFRSIPAAARIYGQGFLSPSLEYLVEIPTSVCLLACALVMARIEKRSLNDYGLARARGAGKHFLWGLLWGLCAFSTVIAIIAMRHGFSPGNLALHGTVLSEYAGLWAVAFLLVGFVEEFLYRGYIQFTLAKAIGFWPAAVVWSLAFGGVHLANPGENLAGVLQVFVFAILLCLTLRRTGSLWFAMGLHAAWDYSETFLFSVRDSGYAASGVLLTSSFHGPSWLTGGSVGPEASVFSIVVLGLAIVLFHFLYPQASPSQRV
jgi:uncharacterized protein